MVLLIYAVVGAEIGHHSFDWYSRSRGVPVLPLIGHYAIPSACLFAYALLIATVVGVPLSYLRRAAIPVAVALGSIPFFWLAVIAPLLFMKAANVQLDFGWLSSDRFGLLDFLHHATLPAVVVAAAMVPAMLGAPSAQRGAAGVRAIIWRLPDIIAAQMIVEIVFGWPALGRLFFSALWYQSDLAVCWALLLCIAILATVARFAAGAEAIPAPKLQDPRRRPLMLVGAVAAIVLLAMIIANALVQDPLFIDNTHWNGTPLPPCFVDAQQCGGHWLGTDEVGRDILARLATGAKASLGISFCVALIATVLWVCIAWALRRTPSSVAWLVRSFADGVSSFAAWPLLLVLVAVSFEWHHPILKLAPLVVPTATLIGWAAFVRTNAEPVNVQRVIPAFTLQWASIMLMLATIDFFGEGVQPPTSSWGNMLANLQSNLALGAWWTAVLPAACLFVAALMIQLGGFYLRHYELGS